MTSSNVSPKVEFTTISEPRVSAGYNLPIGYLRAFVTVLVLAHHAVLAYFPGAPRPGRALAIRPYWWTAFPVVDSQSWSGFQLLVGFNDIFFMSLMFFLSGLFVWGSLERKGVRTFLRDRGLRLGIPFVVAALVVAPLAYYPAYLLTTAPQHSFSEFVHQWLSLGEWPAGPAWFVWLLLAFDVIAALVFSVVPNASRMLSRFGSRGPASFFALLLAASAVAYIPLVLIVSPMRWTTFGPFYFQTSRIVHYAVYFFAGISVGVYGIDRGLLAAGGPLARRWVTWTISALVAFAIAIVTALLGMANYVHAPYTWGAIGGCGFVLSCAASCFAFLALFVRFARTPRRFYDALRDNAYGMYLIHYAFVSWVQYSLLRLLWPGFMKGTVAFVAVLVLSLVATAALRRVPAVRRMI